jgi:hypothetical protein
MARVSDRYVKTVLTVIALALAILALNPWITTAQVFKEGGTAPALDPLPPQAMPKGWGRVAGVTVDKWLVFEAADGTVRIVALGGKVMREIKRD